MDTVDPAIWRLPTPLELSAPLVSVILPTRDRPDRIAGALDSILAQSYTNLQVIVVDDGSEIAVADLVASRLAGDARVMATPRDPRASEQLDASGAEAWRARSSAGQVVELVHLPTPVGAARARNVGLARARGDLVAFLDDDDRWEPTKVAEQVAFFNRNPDHGLVSCDYLAVEDTARRKPVVVRLPVRFTAEQLLWVNFAGSFSQVMVRRSRLGGSIWIDEQYHSVEDWDLWLHCARRAPAGSVPCPLVRYVSHAGPRLSHPSVKRGGLERFYQLHSPAMSPACRSFHRAHQAMEVPGAIRRRSAVAWALLSATPAAWPALLGEQLARQCGRLIDDPGLALRLLAALTATERHTASGAARGARDLAARGPEEPALVELFERRASSADAHLRRPDGNPNPCTSA